jgi:methylphosphotriester-DNA--protein-cysteine methyltransferase
MLYRVYAPHPALAPYVRCYWRLVAPTNPFAVAERLVPDGATELIFNFGDAYRRTDPSGKSVLVVGSHLVGPRTGYFLIEQMGAIDHVAIRFAPGGLYRLLRLPVLELTDELYPVDTVMVDALSTLEAQLFAAHDDSARCALLDHFLLTKLHEEEKGDGALFAHAHGLLQQYAATLSVGELASAAHVSPRTLERTFCTWTGYTPKQYTQIARFLTLLNSLHQRLASANTPHWTTLAHTFEYYDHAHMNKDFLRFTGLTPTDYVARSPWIAKQVADAAPRP